MDFTVQYGFPRSSQGVVVHQLLLDHVHHHHACLESALLQKTNDFQLCSSVDAVVVVRDQEIKNGCPV